MNAKRRNSTGYHASKAYRQRGSVCCCGLAGRSGDLGRGWPGLESEADRMTHRQAIDRAWERLLIKHYRQLQLNWFGKIVDYRLPPDNETYPDLDGQDCQDD